MSDYNYNYQKIAFKSDNFDFIEVKRDGKLIRYEVRIRTTVGLSLIGVIQWDENLNSFGLAPRGQFGDVFITTAGLGDILEFMTIINFSKPEGNGKQIS